MLSIFPELLSYSQVAPFIFRVVLALIFIGTGYSKLFKDFQQTSSFFESLKIKPGKFWAVFVGIAEFVSGVLLLVGFLTQIAALLIAIIMFVAIITAKRDEGFVGGYDFDLLILVVALSLLVLGPGIFSIDLPL